MNPHPLFDQEYYLGQLQSPPEISPFEDYLKGSDESKPDPNIYFDQSYYVSSQMLIEREGSQLSPLEHYIIFSQTSDPPSPNPSFDNDYFRRHNKDLLEAGINPLEPLLTDPLAGIRLYNEKIASRMIMAFDLNDGLRRDNFRHVRLLFFHLGPDEPGEHSMEVVKALAKAKQANEAEVLAITSKRHLPFFKDILGESAASTRDWLLDGAGEVNQAGLALTLRCLVSEFKPTVVISDTALRNEILAGATNYVMPEVPKMEQLLEKPQHDRSEPVKVIIPIRDWQISGVNTWVANVAEGLVNKGLEVELLCCEDFYRFTETMSLPPVKVRIIPFPASKRPLWWTGVRDYISTQHNAVFLTAYYFKFNSIVSALDTRIPMIGVIHSDDPTYYRQCQHLGGYWHRIVTVSKHIADELKQRHPQWEEKISTIHYGVPAWDGDLPEPPAVGEPIRIIYTGRIVHHQKRILDMPQLLEQLDQKGVSYQLDLVGDGRDFDELRSLLKESIDDGKVIMHGRMSTRQIDELLSKSHIFILISEFEGLPLSLLEAMAHGVVPVVSDIDSGIPEVIHHGETGYRVPIGNYERFAEIIAGLESSPEQFRSISEKTRAFFNAELTREVMADRTAALINEVHHSEQREKFTPVPLPSEEVSDEIATFGDVALYFAKP